MSGAPESSSTTLHQAFEWLSAEYEQDWLVQMYVQPPDFAAMAGMRSIVVFGGEGSGKTALRMALEKQVSPNNNPTVLIVKWLPDPFSIPDSSDIVPVFVKQALTACTLALFDYLGRNPATFTDAPKWVQETIVWFLHQYIAGEMDIHLNRLEDSCSPTGIALLKEVIARSPRPLMALNATPPKIIEEIANVVQRLGLSGIWIVIDGLETGVEANPHLANSLKAILSTLALFEQPGFALKLIAPLEIEPELISSGGVIRRRLNVHNLDWSCDDLVKIVEKRLAAASGQSQFHISDLCPNAALLTWLEKYGGYSPRGWLELIRPLAETRLLQQQPLDNSQLRQLQHRHPPKLRIELSTESIFIGYGRLPRLQPIAYKLLLYLYQNRQRPCSRQELYYRVYMGLDNEPRATSDVHWIPRKQWVGIIDTALWRLRQVVEPDPKDPIYILSDAGKGSIHLQNTW